MTSTANAMTNPGMRAVNERATPSGTASGILMTQFFFTQRRYSCTARMDIRIAVNIPDVDRRVKLSPPTVQPPIVVFPVTAEITPLE